MILSPGFLRGLVVAIAAAMIAPVVIRSTRRDALWIISVPAAAAYYGTAFPGFVVVSILGFLTARALGSVRVGSTRWRWTAFALVVLAVLFTAGRLGRWDRPVVVVSEAAPLFLCTLDMWLALRLVTLFWEVGSGAVAAPATAAYVGWVALPMTLGGPLLRYSELPTTAASRPGILRSPAWWGQLTVAAGKIVAGALLGTLPGLIGERWPEARLLRGLVLVFISGPPGFYLMFAGYCQAMQLLARLAGVDVPDSFNWPFGRENISAFWASWNMTATRVFRDYLFYNRWGMRRYNVYANTLILFVLVGLWHGANEYWLLVGLLHGMMFSTFLVWRRLKMRRAARGRLEFRTPGAIGARVLTYLSLCATWHLSSKILQWLGMV